MKASVIDYLGKYEGGILVSISIMFEGNYYDSIFFYTSNQMIITIDDSLKEVIGEIEFRDDYIPLMESIIKNVEPYETVIDKLKEYDPNWHTN